MSAGMRFRSLNGWKALLAMLFGISWMVPAIAAEPFRLYFIAAGSSQYASGTSEARGFPSVFGANKSAKAIAARLVAGAAQYGIQLSSADSHFIDMKDIESAISQVEAQIKADHAKNPLVLFYFAGHGISEGVGWSLFAVPGTFLYKGNLSDQSIEGIAADTIPAATVVDRLDRLGVRYVAIFDTCYEGEQADFASSVLTGAAVQSLKSVAEILRYQNEFHQKNPVLFSTSPGTVVSTVADPLNPTSITRVAPLARRMILLLQKTADNGGSLSLGEFVRSMTSPDLDAKTAPAVTSALPAKDWEQAMLSYPGAPGTLRETLGSGVAGKVCCQDKVALSGQENADHTMRFVGSTEFSGGPGEFITDGKTVRHSGDFSVSQDGPGSIAVTYDDDGESWELDFGAPKDARFRRGHYKNVVRYSFAENGEPTLAITGASRACNEVKGSFDIKSINYDSSERIISFSAAFEQYCDGIDKKLDGSISVKRN